MTDEEEVLEVVRAHCEEIRVPYAPDMILNVPRNCLHGEDAEDLIYAAADRIGLARATLERDFPFDTYFEPESPFCPPVDLYYLIKRCLGYGWPAEKPPITAAAFAALLADLKCSAGKS